MCYQNAASSGPQGQTALQRGILVLFLPAVGMFLGILALLLHRRTPAGEVRATGEPTSESLGEVYDL